KHTVPLCPARGDVIDVKYCLGKALVKNARLHLKGNLVGQEVGFDRSKRAQSLRAGPERHNRSDYDAAKRKDRNRNQNSSATDTQGGESDDFAIGGHAAETKEDPYENRHRNGKCQNAGKEAKKEFCQLSPGTRMAYEEFHEADQLRNEKDKREDDEAKERMTKNFADDVPIQDAHEAFAECSTPPSRASGRCRR